MTAGRQARHNGHAPRSGPIGIEELTMSLDSDTDIAMPTDEISAKLQKLGKFLDRHALHGVLLQHRNNFAWITGGRDNHIANNSPVGVAAIYATRDRRVCITNTIEAPRMKEEELAGTGIDVVAVPWWDPSAGRKAAIGLIEGKAAAADHDEYGLGLKALPADFRELRWQLTPEEIARYREGGKRASAAMETACFALKPGMSEHEVAGILDHHIHAAGLNPVVTLIAADERIVSFRHPIPTDHKVARYVMLVTCAEYGSLISNITRFVSFGTPPEDIRRRQQAVCNVDAAINLATRPRRSFAEMFADLQRAYADNGFADQWQLHHQGGSTGYAGREAFANPTSTLTAMENQAFAWNPSITGVKSEDTILCQAKGIEVLTSHSKDWPTVLGKCPAGELRRPDILIM